MAANIVNIRQGFGRKNPLHRLRIQMFGKATDRASIVSLAANPLITGITTNPFRLRKAGVEDYEAFAKEILTLVTRKPTCWQVCTNELSEIPRQGKIIHSWADNVFVQVPVTNTRGEGAYAVIRDLAESGVKVNVIGVMTSEQLRQLAQCLCPETPAIVSVAGGRIADTGVDPTPTMQLAKRVLQGLPQTQLLWASVRQVWNIIEANAAGCDIVAVPQEILEEAERRVGTDMKAANLDVVRTSARDIAAAGFTL